MNTTPTLLAACVLAQAPNLLYAQFDFGAEPTYEFVTARLERAGLEAIAEPYRYGSLDSVQLFRYDDELQLEYTGSAVFGLAGGQLTIRETTVSDAGIVSSVLEGPLETPADGQVAYTQTVIDPEADGPTALTHSGTFAGGAVQNSQTQLYLNVFVPTISTDLNRYYYEGGRLVRSGSSSGISITGVTLPPEPSDSATYEYDGSGRLSAVNNYSYELDDNGVGSYTGPLRFALEYVSDDRFRAHSLAPGGDTAGTFTYTFTDGVLDSFVYRVPGLSDVALGFYRTGDVSSPDLIQLDYVFQGELSTRAVYYFDGAVSGVPERPVIAGAFRHANPAVGGDVVRFDGEIPADARLEIIAVSGQRVHEAGLRPTQDLPPLASGLYYLVARAPGFRPVTSVVAAGK